MSSSINSLQIEENRTRNQKAIRKYNELCAAKKIRNNFRILPQFSEGELIRRREDNRHVRAYMSQAFNVMFSDIEYVNCAFLLIDVDGCTIRIKALQETLDQLAEKGIMLGTAWQMERIGVNAVTIGLKEHTASKTIGADNYQKILQDTAIYFAPLIVSDSGKNEFFGGVAVIVPVSEANPAYYMTASSMAHSFMIRLAMSWRMSDAYNLEDKGMVLLDRNLKFETFWVTHHNTTFFDLLGLPRETRREAYFKNAECYFDPLPMNKTFWDRVSGNNPVNDEEMTIYVHGKPKELVVSVAPIGNPNLQSNGMIVYLTSRKQQARQVAEKAGNSAILTFDNIVGDSEVMKSRIRRAERFAHTDSNVMILGESGVGKDVFAQAIHNLSSRSKGPFVAVNCGAIPRDLIESELFGYDSGAFTGAKKQGNIGKFELANGGTLFLDEIGEMPLDLQATLLRAVEQKKFMRLGSSKVITADVKIISATNADITRMIEEKKFRSDLYYRLSTMSLYLPPLRERGNDPVLLAKHFIRVISDKIGRSDTMTLTEDAERFLLSCPWAGNVRELQNLIECLVQLYPETVITVDMIRENLSPLYFHSKEPEHRNAFGWDAMDPDGTGADRREEPEDNMADGKKILTEQTIREALERCGGNRSKAAEYLGVGRRTLYRYIDKLDIGNK